MKIIYSKNTRGEEGFTLVEILIAITLFAVGILGATSMQIMAIQTNAKANRTTEAYAVASDQMEKLLKMDYDDIQSSLDENGDVSPVQVDEYTLTWTVANDSPINNTKTINVTVRWNYQGNHQATITQIKGGS